MYQPMPRPISLGGSPGPVDDPDVGDEAERDDPDDRRHLAARPRQLVVADDDPQQDDRRERGREQQPAQDRVRVERRHRVADAVHVGVAVVRDWASTRAGRRRSPAAARPPPRGSPRWMMRRKSIGGATLPRCRAVLASPAVPELRWALTLPFTGVPLARSRAAGPARRGRRLPRLLDRRDERARRLHAARARRRVDRRRRASAPASSTRTRAGSPCSRSTPRRSPTRRAGASASGSARPPT